MTKEEKDLKKLIKDTVRFEAIAEGYIDGVLDGSITAGRFVKLACKRHRNDNPGKFDAKHYDPDRWDYKPWKHSNERGLYFDHVKARHAVKFFSFLKLWKGKEYQGLEFTLAPHFVFIIWVLMGWYRADRKRRFRKAYFELGRKSAKTHLASGLGAYFFIADDEEGAEVYSCAVTRDQAKLVWTSIKNLTKKSIFAKGITYFTHNLSILNTNSKCEPLSSDAKSLDGLDTHFASLDELHAHPTREVHDLISDSIGARSQPLILIITTAGFNQTGICYETRDYVATILKNVGINDG